MTVALYARRKAWPLDGATVRLSHSRIHAADCAECETTAGRLDRVEWSLQFDGDLTAAQRTRLLEIAQMCPVHRTSWSEMAMLLAAVTVVGTAILAVLLSANRVGGLIGDRGQRILLRLWD